MNDSPARSVKVTGACGVRAPPDTIGGTQLLPAQNGVAIGVEVAVDVGVDVSVLLLEGVGVAVNVLDSVATLVRVSDALCALETHCRTHPAATVARTKEYRVEGIIRTAQQALTAISAPKDY